MSDDPTPRGAIGPKTAIVLYVLLTIWAVATLKGTALFIALLIVAALAVKSYVHYVRSRLH
jgi:energy-converting hydrogenase Eha subunit B